MIHASRALDRLEQVERRVAPALRVPHARLDLARRDARRARGRRCPRGSRPGTSGTRRDGQAVVADALARVAARPAEPDADHRQLQVVRRLDEVAGEDAEAAGVDRELLVEPELHAEVGDGGGHGAAPFKASGRAADSTTGQRRGGYTPGASRGTRASPRARRRSSGARGHRLAGARVGRVHVEADGLVEDALAERLGLRAAAARRRAPGASRLVDEPARRARRG